MKRRGKWTSKERAKVECDEKRRQKEEGKEEEKWGTEKSGGKSSLKGGRKGETEENEKGLEKRKSNRRYRLILGF